MGDQGNWLTRKIDGCILYIDRKPASEQRRLFLGISVALVLAYIVFSAYSYGWSDVAHYYGFSQRVIDDRLVPYSGFPFEYPPLAIVFMLVPRLFSFNDISYNIAYILFAFVGYLVAAHYTFKLADSYGYSRGKSVFWVLFAFASLGFFAVTRYDIFPTAMIIIAFWEFRKGKNAWAFAILGLATMTKLFPALAIAALLMVLLVRREWKNLAVGALVSVAVCVLVELPFVIIDPSTAFDYLDYHSDRGLQVESVFAGVIMFFALFVSSDVGVGDSYGSTNLTGVLPEAIAPYMNALTAVVLIVLVLAVLVCAAKKRPACDRDYLAAVITVAMITVTLVFSKVFSAQYGVWFMFLYPLLIPRMEEGRFRDAFLLFFVIYAVTAVLNFTLLYNNLSHMGAWGIVNNLVKNIANVALAALTVHFLFRHTLGAGKKTEAEPRAEPSGA